MTKSLLLLDSSSDIHSILSNPSNLEEFSDILNKILTNKIFRENLVRKGTEFINRYLINQGNSSEFLANFLHRSK